MRVRITFQKNRFDLLLFPCSPASGKLTMRFRSLAGQSMFNDNDVSVSLYFLEPGWRISEFLARC